MNELIAVIVGLEITEIMEKHRIMERVAKAPTVEEKTEIVKESIGYVQAFADDVFRNTPEAQEAKGRFMEGFAQFQFEYFDLPVPAA